MRALIAVAFLIKPLYGLITDNIPIFGYQKKYYVLFSGIVGILCYTSFIYIQDLVISSLALVFAEVTVALSDVIADGIMIIESRKDKVRGPGLL